MYWGTVIPNKMFLSKSKMTDFKKCFKKYKFTEKLLNYSNLINAICCCPLLLFELYDVNESPKTEPKEWICI